SVVHDLSLAKAFGTHAILIHEGKAVAAGEIGEVLSPDHLNPVYGMDVRAWMRQMLGQWE
ncbi:MAG TPA: ABC transporter ATP-binding protein, partial [Bacillota bacterium]|nr:ABC transporter ATP-binding protein [Bacillota bacterium]